MCHRSPRLFTCSEPYRIPAMAECHSKCRPLVRYKFNVFVHLWISIFLFLAESRADPESRTTGKYFCCCHSYCLGRIDLQIEHSQITIDANNLPAGVDPDAPEFQQWLRSVIEVALNVWITSLEMFLAEHELPNMYKEILFIGL